ncbi:MAG: UDP-3-O-(3-hydroxymyristoyl)glucosamine N-acyltransferase [Proteobacteria bacterium]|nr:UDP-3-O-(3-hydroxymyristoyl)glucosamine N-acyltransferase [Pseudomonadota bacterium]
MANNYHNNNGPFTVAELAEFVGCDFKGDGEKKISRINAIQEARSDELAFLDNPKYAKFLSETKAGVVIIKPDLVDKLPEGVSAILSEFPHPDYAKVSNKFYADLEQIEFISDRADVHETAQIGKNVILEAGVVVCENAKIADGVKIGANSYIAKNVEIGVNSVIKNNVSIECTKMGSDCLIHAGVRIGQDGFGFAFDQRVMEVIKVPQIGGVIIGNHVEIGANTTIDRGSLLDTEIGDMTKLDNLVQVGHNVKLGRMCQIVAQTGIAGSTTIGDGCIFGGQSGVAGHVKVADRVMLASRGAISKNISKEGEVLGGVPAVPIREWRKAHAIVSRLVKQSSKK